jgi:PHD/YefM family antitoxin component YafN of YafNO toxin-antitoxin module
MTHVIMRDETFGTPLDAIMAQAVETNGPVLCTVEGHGDMVIMPSNAYADLLDRIQTVSEVVSGDILFEDVPEEKN